MISVHHYLYRHDEFDVREWRTLPKVGLALVVLYSYFAVAAAALLAAETGAAGANIATYRDAFWALQMSATTIGFGDFYPVTPWGRRTVMLTFYVGVGLTSFVGVTLASRLMQFSATEVKNRELRHQLHEVIRQNRVNEALNAEIRDRDKRNEALNAEILAHNRQLEARIVELTEKLGDLPRQPATDPDRNFRVR